jgi:hypothetical protein
MRRWGATKETQGRAGSVRVFKRSGRSLTWKETSPLRFGVHLIGAKEDTRVFSGLTNWLLLPFREAGSEKVSRVRIRHVVQLGT